MTVATLDLDPWVDQIKAAAPSLRLVGVASDLEGANDVIRSVPAAFVLPARSDADPVNRNTTIGNNVQRVTVSVSVLVVIKNSRAERDARRDLRPVRNEIWNSLLGWTAPGALFQTTYGGGAFLRWANGYLWWQDIFKTEQSLRY